MVENYIRLWKFLLICGYLFNFLRLLWWVFCLILRVIIRELVKVIRVKLKCSVMIVDDWEKMMVNVFIIFWIIIKINVKNENNCRLWCDLLYCRNVIKEVMESNLVNVLIVWCEYLISEVIVCVGMSLLLYKGYFVLYFSLDFVLVMILLLNVVRNIIR